MKNMNLGASSEALSNFSNNVSKLEGLEERRVEIIKKVLEAEEDLASTRIGYLDEYFDKFSKTLDSIVAEKTSKLSTAFKILDSLADESVKKAAKAAERAQLAAEKAAEATAKNRRNDGTKPETVDKKSDSEASPPKNDTKDKEAAKRNAETIRRAREAELASTEESADSDESIEKTTNRKSTRKNNQRNRKHAYSGNKERATNTDTEENSNEASNATNKNPPASGGGNSGGNGNGGHRSTNSSGGENDEPPSEDVKVFQPIPDELLNALGDADNTGENLAPENAKQFEQDLKNKLNSLTEFFLAAEDARRDALLDSQGKLDFDLNTIEEHRREQNIKSLKELGEQTNAIRDKMIERERLLTQTEEERALQVEAIKTAQFNEALDIGNEVLRTQQKINAQRDYEASDEGIAIQSQKAQSLAADKGTQKLEEQRVRFIKNEEYRLEKEYNRKLTEQEKKDIIDQANLKYELSEENIKRTTELTERQENRSKEAEIKATQDTTQKAIDNAMSFNSEMNMLDRYKSLKTIVDQAEEDGADRKAAATAVAVKALSSLAQQLENTIDEIAGKKGKVDTRLQGSKNETWAGSYWDQIVHDITAVGAINPYFQQKEFSKNIEDLVDRGIAFDLEQRAFLMTITDKIATTFDATDGTLLRLIKIQQEDSTAGRLGMEAALNAFLNEMYENTEYLKTVASSVRQSLQEMEALMTGAEATEVEFQVQKWLGSLSSVGMSDSATQSLAEALGQIAAGQIEGITNGGAGNLLIMAANDAGLSIADILTDGINASDTNKLLRAAVKYLGDLADSSKDNQVVQQQLAGVFGVKASDLKAATNLVLPGSTDDIYNNSMTYNSMVKNLISMASSMHERTSMAEMMTNIWENVQYTMAGSMASNPISYFIYKAATLLDNTVGGIPIPDISIYGNAVALNTTVADLMRVASMSAGILGSIGDLASGLGNSFSGRAMLEELGITSGSGLAVVERGDGGGISKNLIGGKQSTSSSGYTGNASGSDIKDSTMQDAKDSKKQQMIEAKEEEEASEVMVLNTTVVKIYELLDDVVHGKSSFRVKVDDYGLIKQNSGGTSSNSLNGIRSGGITSSGIGSSSRSTSSGGNSGSVDLGNWTTI